MHVESVRDRAPRAAVGTTADASVGRGHGLGLGLGGKKICGTSMFGAYQQSE